MLGSSIQTSSPNTLSSSTTIDLLDDILLTLGTDGDVAIVERSTSLNANTTLTGVLIGTPVSAAIAANSLMISNITANGDIAFYTNLAGNSQMQMLFDASASTIYVYDNLNMANNHIINTYFQLYGDTTAIMYVRNAADDGYATVYCGGVNCTAISFQADALSINARAADNAYTNVTARDNAVGSSEVMRWQGATKGYTQFTRGFTNLLCEAVTANAQTYNPAPTAVTLTAANTKAFTGTGAQFAIPAIAPAANGAGITLTGINMTQGAITNTADSEAITVKHIIMTGAAGVANETGAYVWTGLDITTPAQAANSATNLGKGVKITGGAKAGGASATQIGVDITMAAATDPAVKINVGAVFLGLPTSDPAVAGQLYEIVATHVVMVSAG